MTTTFSHRLLLPSSESEIDMQEELLPCLYYSLGAIITLLIFCTTFVLGTWQKRRCQCCVLHSRGVTDRLDTTGFPYIEFSTFTTKYKTDE